VTNNGDIVSGLVGQVDKDGNILILQYDNPYRAGTPQVVETITGVNAVDNTGHGIVAQSAATKVSGSGASIGGDQITVNATDLNTGRQRIELGGGYRYYANPNDPNSGQLCGPNGCVDASNNEGHIRASIGDNIVDAQIGTQTIKNANSDATSATSITSSIIKTTVTDVFTGKTTDVTGTTAVPVDNTGSSGSSGQPGR
jgi:hypothetical protein